MDYIIGYDFFSAFILKHDWENGSGYMIMHYNIWPSIALCQNQKFIIKIRRLNRMKIPGISLECSEFTTFQPFKQSMLHMSLIY